MQRGSRNEQQGRALRTKSCQPNTLLSETHPGRVARLASENEADVPNPGLQRELDAAVHRAVVRHLVLLPAAFGEKTEALAQVHSAAEKDAHVPTEREAVEIRREIAGQEAERQAHGNAGPN